MACGTPVVALARGAAPEVVAHGRTGFVVEQPEQLAAAISACATLDPADCRRHVSSRFSLDTMATGYEGAYRRVLARQGAGPTAISRTPRTRTVV
jgi:glycosyltransferase involved in cell wall biosynthesis